jgi:hypothetical protein
MKRVINHIRNKPSHHRDRIIWICAAVAAVLLLLTWAIVGNGRKTTTNDNFFQNFNQGVEQGKNTFDGNLLEQ